MFLSIVANIFSGALICSGKKSKSVRVVPPIEIPRRPPYVPRLKDLQSNHLYSERLKAKKDLEDEKVFAELAKDTDIALKSELRSRDFELQLHRSVSRDASSAISTNYMN